jgi:acetyl/propionyl-CoA carboxylase alpha subunit
MFPNKPHNMKLFNKILIANRGEIAVRITRSLKKLGIKVVVVYSSKDQHSLFVRMADEAYLLSGEKLSETYLDIEKILQIAINTGVDAIHPGYGFLSENPSFALAVSNAGINFIGPPASVIHQMGDKLEARKAVSEIGVPLISGLEGTVKEIYANRIKLHYPILLKATAGGGGKAMRIVNTPDEINDALETTSREALNYFGSGTLYAEHYFRNARHIEVQVLADHYGNILIPGERECSLQRRYQKVIEETPSVFLTDDKRQQMFEAARSIVRQIGYVNAGTIEFLVDENQDFYFLEMNTRIQVEHGITEMVTGIDLVEQQVLIAAGNELQLRQPDIKSSGHSIEARLYAEDPEHNFLPSPGDIIAYKEPDFPGLRIDASANGPFSVDPSFDPMIAKIMVLGHDRSEAIIMLKKALDSTVVLGTATNRGFLSEILDAKDYLNNSINTAWLELHLNDILDSFSSKKKSFEITDVLSLWLASRFFDNRLEEKSGHWGSVPYWRSYSKLSATVNEKKYEILLRKKRDKSISFVIDGEPHTLELKSINTPDLLLSLDGKWISGYVVGGKTHEDIVMLRGLEFRIKPIDFLPGEPYLNMDNETGFEAIKVLRAPMHGKIVKINANEGARVNRGDHLFTLDAMKVENKILSPADGCVKEIKVKQGDQVHKNHIIIVLDECTKNNNQ